jgi:hypothetical protein
MARALLAARRAVLNMAINRLVWRLFNKMNGFRVLLLFDCLIDVFCFLQRCQYMLSMPNLGFEKFKSVLIN